MAKVGIVATLSIQAGKEAEFETVFNDLRSQVLANEAGCEMYTSTSQRLMPRPMSSWNATPTMLR